MNMPRQKLLVRCGGRLLLGCALIFGPALHGANSADTKALFKNPPRDYSTGPLWVWNDMLTNEQIRDTLRDLAGQHVKQVWVHPRPGLMTPYLSPRWFELWKLALEEAERLDMNVWIYDENSYPSGFAGGWVPELMPESRGRGLVLKESKTPPKWSADIIGVYRIEGDATANVTAKVKAGESLPEGRYLLATEVRSGNSPWHGGRSYVNLLSPGVSEKFIEVTFEAYRREIGDQFGKRVPGAFTDEPELRPAGGLPWSEVMVDDFKRRWNYDLLEHLPSLTLPIGDWRKVRHNYYQLLNELFIERWAKPNHDFCQANRLEWTGHYWDHEWPNCIGVPDNMSMYPWHQRPAIDCLMNRYAENTHAQFGNVRMVKELSSVVNQCGIRRTLCEIYGAGGWDLRFEDMKRIGDWLSVLGVNTLNQHLSYVTLRGARKRDHPLSFSYHAPWWDAYHVSADYFARLSVALSQGEQVNRILVLQPTTTAWLYQHDGAKLGPLGDTFFKLLMALEAAQVEYDIGCEELMAQRGSVGLEAPPVTVSDTASSSISLLPRTAALRVGTRDYSTVVIPPLTENLNAQTVELLEQFVRLGGGQVLCMGDPPGFVEGQSSGRVKALAESPSWRRTDTTVVASLAPKAGGPEGFGIYRTAADAGILFHHRRLLDDGELLFLVNTSIEFPSAGVVESRHGSAEQWNLYSGRIDPYPFQAQTGGGVRLSYKLPPSGSLLLFLCRKQAPAVASPSEAVRVITAKSLPEVRRLHPNVLTIDHVDVSAAGETRTNIYFYQANQFIWQKNGMDRNPWDSAVQFKDELISKQFPAESGFEASYRFELRDVLPAELSIVIERPDLYRISCNGQPVHATGGAWWLDKAFGRLEIAAFARLGENVVTLRAKPFTMYHELEPAYLLGALGVQPAERGFVLTADPGLKMKSRKPDGAQGGGWNSQDHPFYSAGVAYVELFEVNRIEGKFGVALGDWYGSVAKVNVNGKLAGYIDAPPWECEVTHLLKQGENRVEVEVIGTLRNLLGPHHGNPGVGSAWPGMFQQAPKGGLPPGLQYSTIAYGLFEPFVLKQRVEH